MKNTETQKDFNKSEELIFCWNKIGKYTLLKEISRGGMGIVFESIQEEINRKIAIKILPFSSSIHSTKSIERFKREASIVSKIKHKGVAQVFDFGKDDRGYFLVMEFIEGNTLEENLKNNFLTFNDKLSIFIKILNVLKDLHSLNIVHRDIKPSNIMIKNDGDIVLLDFGISKCLDDEALLKLTQEPIGTPVYMPPEFIISKGHNADQRSDIYSLGVLLYELVTGKLPFNIDQPYYLILEQITKSDFRLPTNINSNLSKKIETIILKCMSKDPNHRYRSVNELLHDILNYKKIPMFSLTQTIVLLRYFFYKTNNIIILFSFLIFLFFISSIYIFNSVKKSKENNWFDITDIQLNDIVKTSKLYRNIDENIPDINNNYYFTVKDNYNLTWNNKESGYIILNSKNQNALKICFDYEIVSRDSFFGAFISSTEKLSGYLLKINTNTLALCKNHYDNVVKEFAFSKTKKINSISFTKSGAEINVFFNKVKVINFIDYDPIISESNSSSGLFFASGHFLVKNFKFYRPKNPLLISPLILGQRFFELSQFDNAIKEYEKIVNEYSEKKISQIAFFKMGVSYMKKGDYDKALDIYDKIINSPLDSEILPQVYYQKGIVLFKKKKFNSSETIFLTAINKFTDSDISLNIFLFLYEVINYSFSNTLSDKELSFFDDRFKFMLLHFPSKRSLLAPTIRSFIMILMNNHKLNEALYYLQKIPEYFLFNRPTLAWGQIQKAELYQKMKDFNKAEGIYKKAYEEYKDFSVYGSWAAFKLGELYEIQGKTNEAYSIWKEIIGYYNDKNEFYLKAKEKLFK